MASRSLGSCLNAAGEAARLLPHAEKLLRLQQLFERCAPRELAGCARVVNLNSGKVKIHAANGAVAAKLNQLAPRLRVEFLESGLEVNAVEVRVRRAPPAAEFAAPAAARAPVAAGAKRGLAGLAAALPADSPLRASIEQLIRRSR